MGATSPELTASLFIERFNAGDAASIAQLYEDDAVFTHDGEEKAIGRALIERALAGFMMAKLKMRLRRQSLCLGRSGADAHEMGARRLERRCPVVGDFL